MRFGIDVGGTTVKIGVVENYEIIDSYSVKTTKETLFDDVFVSIKKYIEDHNVTNVEAIGMGLPGNVINNHINLLPNIGIKDLDLMPIVNKYFPNIPFGSTNDANAAALGEFLGDKNHKESSYMITLGTGVGGGLVLNGKVRDGVHCACGEIGHMYIDYIHNYQCGCGLKGCFETVTSATGIVRLAKEYYGKYETKLPLDMSAKDVFDAAKENDPLASYVFDLVCKYLGRGLANIAATVDIDTFYIGGGVAACGQMLADGITKYYKEYCFFAVRDTEIKLAKLGNAAGALGAAYVI